METEMDDETTVDEVEFDEADAPDGDPSVEAPAAPEADGGDVKTDAVPDDAL